MITCIVCVLLMLLTIGSYFLGQTSSDPYGNRLENIEDYNVTNELKKMEEYFNNNKKVESSSVRLQGKIIYVTATVDAKESDEDIQSIAATSIEKLTAEQLEFYEIQFIFKRDKMSPYLGSKSASNKIISWANNKIEADESEE